MADPEIRVRSLLLDFNYSKVVINTCFTANFDRSCNAKDPSRHANWSPCRSRV